MQVSLRITPYPHFREDSHIDSNSNSKELARQLPQKINLKAERASVLTAVDLFLSSFPVGEVA